MKKYFLITCITLVYACGSSDGDEPTNNPDPVPGCTDPQASNYQSTATIENNSCTYDGYTQIGTPPSTAVKNVIIEQFTGEWCGWCVDGKVRINNMMNDNPDRVFTMAIHQGDFLENTASQFLIDMFDVSSYPSGIINRKGDLISRTLWEANVNSEMQQTAIAAVAMDTKLSNNSLEGVVYVDFKQDQGEQTYYVTLYVIEDAIPAENQNNYYSNRSGSEGHPFFAKASVLSGDDYLHNNVIREKIMDYQISSTAVANQGVYTRKFSTDISAYENENVKILAVVTEGNLKNILNVNTVSAGATANW